MVVESIPEAYQNRNTYMGGLRQMEWRVASTAAQIGQTIAFPISALALCHYPIFAPHPYYSEAPGIIQLTRQNKYSDVLFFDKLAQPDIRDKDSFARRGMTDLHVPRPRSIVFADPGDRERSRPGG